MNFSHFHVPVKDLPAALDWLARVWDVRPDYEAEGAMAVLTVHGASLILDAGDADGPTTIGFSSEDCDADYRAASEGGAETIELPTDRPWGVRAAYLRGPGAITFEIEQALPASQPA